MTGEKSEKLKVLLIENQKYQFKEIFEFLNEGYEVFPDLNGFKRILDFVRICLNNRYSKERRDTAFAKLVSEIKDFNPELFLIDHILVGNYFAKNGIDLVEKLQEIGFTQPVVFLSNTKPNTAEVISNLTKIKNFKVWIHKGYAGEEILSPDYFEKHVLLELSNILTVSLKEDILKILRDKIPNYLLNAKEGEPDRIYANYLSKLIESISNDDYNLSLDFRHLLNNLSLRNFIDAESKINGYKKCN
jgi:hypothetical protein